MGTFPSSPTPPPKDVLRENAKMRNVHILETLNTKTYILHLRRKVNSGDGGDVVKDISHVFLHLRVQIGKTPTVELQNLRPIKGSICNITLFFS